MQTPLDFCDELLSAAAQDEGTGFCGGAEGKEVVAFGAELDLFEEAAGAEVVRLDVAAGGLGGGACGGADAGEVGSRDAAGAEDVTVGEVSG